MRQLNIDYGKGGSNRVPLPNCLLCNDFKGAMVDLETNEWAHHTCVNWHNEIWFETDDKKLTKYGGALDYERFSLKCYICKVQQGSCIECDLSSCKKPFHVRCAIGKDLIMSANEMDEEMRLGVWECKVYCNKHKRHGQRRVQKIKMDRTLNPSGS